MLSLRLQTPLFCTARQIAIILLLIFTLFIIAGRRDVDDRLVNADETERTSLIKSSKKHGPKRKAPWAAQPEYEIRPPERNGSHKTTSKKIADVLLAGLLRKIGNGRGPIIIGGIGDSGTRGVREVLQNIGAEMLDYPNISPISRDSRIFMTSYETTTTSGHRWLRNPGSIYNQAISLLHSLKYNESNLPYDFWHSSRQFVAKMVTRSLNASLSQRGSLAKLDPWGFKHPRTALILPVFIASLGSKFLFVHVLRDGKDVIQVDKQKFFKELCSRYYGYECRNMRPQRASFWADVNRDIFEIALNSDMKADQYIAIRTEDLVLGNDRCFRRLAHFLHVPSNNIGQLVQHAIEVNLGHESSYFGNHLNEAQRIDVETSFVTHNITTLQALNFWGYKPDSYALATDCESLPWMSLMREKKGPLPGDDQLKPSPADKYAYAPQPVLSRNERPRNSTGKPSITPVPS